MTETFRRIGVVDHPIRGIVNDNGVWKVWDVGTGELLTSFISLGPRSCIICVLDGDHFLTDECQVFSISKGKVVQDIPELKELLKGSVKKSYPAETLSRNVVSLPAAKRNAYALSTPYWEEVFDPRRVTQKLVAYHYIEYPTGNTIQIWNWDGKRLEKDHEVKFDNSVITNVVGISDEKNPWMVAIHVDEEVIVYDTLKREQLFRFGVEDQDQILPLPTGELGALIHTDWGVSLRRYPGVDRKPQEIALLGGFMDVCILADNENPEHYLIELDGHKLLRTVDPKKVLDIKIDGKVLSPPFGPKTEGERPPKAEDAGRFNLGSYLHGNDVIATRRRKEKTKQKEGKEEDKEENKNVIIFDLLTGESKGKFALPDATADVMCLPKTVNAYGEPVERFLISTQETKFPFEEKKGKYLLEFTIEGYKLREKREITNLLPISGEQRKIMAEDIVDLFPQSSVPKEVIGVVANFI